MREKNQAQQGRQKALQVAICQYQKTYYDKGRIYAMACIKDAV